jgi:hypothetical protein
VAAGDLRCLDPYDVDAIVVPAGGEALAAALGGSTGWASAYTDPDGSIWIRTAAPTPGPRSSCVTP